MSRNWIESSTLKMSGARKPILCAKSAPATPMSPAEYANAMVLYTARLTPIDCAATSLSRMAAHEHAGRRGHGRRQRHRDDPGHAEVLGEIDVRVGADAEEGGVPQADEAGVAGEHHQGHAAEAVDEDEAEVAEVLGHQAREHEQREEERDVRVPLDAVAEEAQVLRVGRLEREPHAAQTFFRPTAPNMPCGRTASTRSSTTYAATSLNPCGR